MKKIGIILLFAFPPLILSTIFYFNEHEELYIFNDVVFQGGSQVYINSQEELIRMKDAEYNSNQDNYPVKLIDIQEGQEKEQKIDIKNFISKKFSDHVGIFAALPLHKVCLVNNNEVYIMDLIYKESGNPWGDIGIKQKDGYEFFANRDHRDCKKVFISKFKENPLRAEINYAGGYFMDSENTKRSEENKGYYATTITTTVLAKNSKLVVTLNCWVLIIFYIIILPIWSAFLFQYKKIFDFINGKNI